MNRMYSWIIASRTESVEKPNSGTGSEMICSFRSTWLRAPSRPISGNVHAIARVRKLVQNGASAMMKSAIWMRRLSTLSARKYATGKPRTRHATTAMTDVTNVESMLSQ